jgi:site-specific recombinase XerD
MRGAIPLSRAEIKSLLKVTKCQREKTLLTIGFSCAFRISAILSLTIGDVSTNGIVHNRVTVAAKNQKTKTGHTVLLNSDAKKSIESLLEWLKAKGIADKSAPLFLSQKRTVSGALKAISRIQAHRIIKDLFAQIGLLGSSYSTHSMRKSVAKYIYDMTGGKIEKVAAILGHKSLNSTIAYLQFNNSDIDDALTAMEF